MTNQLESKLTRSQKRQHVVHCEEDGQKRTLFIDLRYDDQCGNGHNTFSITGSFYEGTYHAEPRGERNLITCGCIHDTIEEFAPQFAHLIKWHLVSSDSPMHYAANACYHASNRDCHGRKKGEPYMFERKLKVNDSPFLYRPTKELLAFIDEVGLDASWSDFELMEIHHKGKGGAGYQFEDKWSFAAMPVLEWCNAPFDTWDEACTFVHAMTNCDVEIVQRATAYGEGKERDFDAARAAAHWPEATEEQLSLPRKELEALLEKRLPALMQEFKNFIESIGFTY